MQVHTLTNQELRVAICGNRVSFPSQVPVFEKQTRPDIHWRLVQLYFIRGWSFRDLGKRYGISPQRVIQIVSMWRMRAVATGYIQEIPEEDPLLAFRGRDLTPKGESGTPLHLGHPMVGREARLVTSHL